MNITQQELDTLSSTKSAEEWDATCDAIKKVRGGSYPPDWWNRVMMSGLAGKVKNNWNCECGNAH